LAIGHFYRASLPEDIAFPFPTRHLIDVTARHF
jgi:hypothetical protein